MCKSYYIRNWCSIAGLVETLSGEGPFTVFAPTDDAFNALPEGTLDAVLADMDLLTSILTHHVAGGSAYSTDLSDGNDGDYIKWN